MEGAFAAILKAEDVVRDEVPTCTLTDRVGEVYQRCQAAGWKVCIVVNDRNVVLGRLRGEAWKVEPGTRVEEIMENGPTTFRPDFFWNHWLNACMIEKWEVLLLQIQMEFLSELSIARMRKMRWLQDQLRKEGLEQTWGRTRILRKACRYLLTGNTLCEHSLNKAPRNRCFLVEKSRYPERRYSNDSRSG